MSDLHELNAAMHEALMALLEVIGYDASEEGSDSIEPEIDLDTIPAPVLYCAQNAIKHLLLGVGIAEGPPTSETVDDDVLAAILERGNSDA